MKTYIFGHLKPDTDAVVSAMALEYLHNHSEEKNPAHENSQAVIVGDLNPETTFIFDKFKIEKPQLITTDDIKEDDQIILVDHNEESQRLAGINQDQIVNIVDHHKVNLNLSQPVCLIFRPWGSTCTVIYHMMKMKGVTPDKTMATLMLAAILSDTVGFKSATTAMKDEQSGKELAEIAEIQDIETFTLEIFKAKSDVSKLSDEQIVTNDYKIFDFGGKKILIDQLETVEQEVILSDKKEGLLKAMETVKSDQSVDYIFVAITDILEINTKLLLLGDDSGAIAIKAFGGTVENNTLDIGPKMSRKKEIAPAIEKALT
jgi:manganese-dependent inorganic pyrophosphatase